MAWLIGHLAKGIGEAIQWGRSKSDDLYYFAVLLGLGVGGY